ncbi:MAG: sulfatase-like hydrolase/transferase [bacterium]|nr:sulfatase-like hydrolase/transferase [bacterium]
MATALPSRASAAAPRRKPNVILIMADDLGYEALACNGGTSYDTPHLDNMASKGMRFIHCYSQPVCTPSRVKIMTGRSNARNYQSFGHLDPNETTFGHIMKDAGYKTCIAGKWQLCGGNDHDGAFPAASGFDESCMWAYHHDLPENARDTYTFFGEVPRKTSRYWNPAIVRNGEYTPTTTDDYGPDIFRDFILDFMKNNQDDPFFVYYPMVLTHNPFVATPDSKNQSDRARAGGRAYFGDMVQYTGKIVDSILQELDTLGIAEDTLVLFTCDNGTYKGITSRMGDRVVRGGKALPIDAGVHVPLIASWKGVIEPNTVCTDIIDFSDFLPTIAQATEASVPTDRTLDGRSFLPQLKGDPAKPRRCALVHYDKKPDDPKPEYRRIRFAYDGRYKLYLDGRMYDVPNDWLEEHPIPQDAMPASASAARARLQDALDTLPEWQPDNSTFQGTSDPALDEYRRKYKR